MKTCFIIKISRWQSAIADLERHPDNVYEINRINVPEMYRGRRYGSELLGQVVAEADAQRVTLRLYPFPSGNLGRRALCDWYARSGFKRAASGIYWYRPPAVQQVKMEKRQLLRESACH